MNSDNYPNSYEQAADIWENRRRKNASQVKIAHNTYLAPGQCDFMPRWTGKREDVCYVIKLHGHSIVEFRPNGEVMLDSCGWRTRTTKDRMNRALPDGQRVYQSQHEWFISAYNTEVQDNTVWEYFDGFIVGAGLERMLINNANNGSFSNHLAHADFKALAVKQAEEAAIARR
tara:strand:+ start:23058 stop:23576 length:519 start_codon:yes stop_codon:yes gene_type:complete